MASTVHDFRPPFELTGRNYIVTGGAQGIGFTIAKAICSMGGNVAIWDIQDKPADQEGFDALSTQFGSTALYLQTDVTKQASLESAFARTLDKFKSVDGCVPAAGIAIDKPFVDQTWDEFTRIQEINVSTYRPSLASHRDKKHANIDPGARHFLHCTTGSEALDRAEEAG